MSIPTVPISYAQAKMELMPIVISNLSDVKNVLGKKFFYIAILYNAFSSASTNATFQFQVYLFNKEPVFNNSTKKFTFSSETTRGVKNYTTSATMYYVYKTHDNINYYWDLTQTNRPLTVNSNSFDIEFPPGGLSTNFLDMDESQVLFSNFDLVSPTRTIKKVSHISDGIDTTKPFVINDGTDPDEGGGNQDWGQGSPVTSTTGGTYDDSSDSVSTGTSTSFKAGQSYNNYYILDLAQIFEVKNKIWSPFTIPGVTKASDAIITMLCMPFELSTKSFDIASKNVQIGNTVMELTTNPWMLNANFNNEIDFGSVKLAPYFGGFQDYSPYTKISIYLPFIGIKELDPTYIQDKTVSVKYKVNFSNGSCIACIYSDGYLYTRINGQLGQSIPLTQVNNSLVEATLNTAMNVGTAAVTKGFAGAGAALVTGALSNVASARPSVSGSVGGGGECELSLPLEVFFIIERPHCAVAQTYPHEKGRPSLLNKQLSNCKGFTTMCNPQCTATCTSTENDMINKLLKEGVIING